MKKLYVFATATLALSLMLTACGTNKAEPTKANDAAQGAATAKTETTEKPEVSPADFSKAVADLVDGIKNPKDGKVDWATAQKLYDEKLKDHVVALDAEYKDKVNDQLTTMMSAGKDGQLAAPVVAQLFDKLLQKATFLTLRHDFNEANTYFKDKERAKKEIAEAKEYYNGALKSMVQERDTAYKTTLITTIDGGFQETESNVDKGDNLAFNIGKQTIDKTMMKAFYLAAGAEQGYNYKIEQDIKAGKTDVKAEQAAGWASFQSLKGYLEGKDKDSAAFIEKQFDLSNDPKNISGDKVNQAFVRAFAAVAKDEYETSFKNWGQDKAVITSYEGRMFIDVLKNDLNKALGGEDKAKALADTAQQQFEATKAGDKAKATDLYNKVKADLEKLAAYGK